MRDGRRQRLGLATGTEDPATSNDGYLDRILSDQEAAEQSNILNLAEDANVNVRDQRYLNDAYQYYLGGGTGNFADEVAIDTPAATTDLGEITADGGAGQATSGVDLGNNSGFNAGVTPGPSGFIGLDPDMDINTQDITDYGTYDPPGLGEVTADNYGTETDLGEVTADNYGTETDLGEITADNYGTETDLGEITADNYGTETDLGEVTADNYGTPKTFDDQYQSIEDVPVDTGINYSEFDDLEADVGAQPTFAAEDVDTQGNLLQSGIDKMKSVFPDFNPIVAAGKIAFNSYIGAPVTLAFDALKAIGGMLPEQSAANKFNQSFTKGGANYKDYGYGVLQAGNIAQDPFGRNPVSAFGNYEETLAEDLNYEGTNKFNLDKKEFAEKYFKELNNNALLSGDINSANTDIDIDTGNVTGDASVAEDAQDLNLTDIKDDMAGINTGDAGVAEAAAAADRAAADLAASNAASVSMGEARYGDGGPGISTPTNEFSDEEFMAGDTSIAAPATGDTASDSFFDAADNAATSSPSLTDAQKQANSDAAIDAARGGGGSSGTLSQAQSTANIDAARGGEGGGGGGNKIVCTMMNDSYGFGSFRNKIWLKHSRDMAPEYQIGYHKIFLPLVKLSKTNKVLKKILEHIAIHRTIDIRQEARGKTHLLGRVYRKILEPVCYLVGKYAK